AVSDRIPMEIRPETAFGDMRSAELMLVQGFLSPKLDRRNPQTVGYCQIKIAPHNPACWGRAPNP
ncbi:MAG: hypothetical protein M0Z99_09310, partial [Betaproteobacteria bacterium]|nr:hypothetical protein [Betaproteobacteria bacterium]